MKEDSIRRFNPVGLDSQNPHVTVCYRHQPPGRVFVANSSRCVDAVVVALSQRGIGLIMRRHIAPATPVRIELGQNGAAPLLDLAAEVVSSTREQDGSWRCACKWVHKAPDELGFVGRPKQLTPERLARVVKRRA